MKFSQPATSQSTSRAASITCSLREKNQTWGWAFTGWVFLLLIAWSANVWGQGGRFQVDPIPEELSGAEAMRAMERARREAPGQREAGPNWPQWRAFASFYGSYLFASMTQPEQLAKLPEMNEEILKDLSRAQRTQANEVSRAILAVSVRNGERLAMGNYHPGVRINATLLLGQLFERPPSSTPALPARQALAPLVRLYRSENVPDGVRAAALMGLHRHVVYGLSQLPAPQRSALLSLTLDLVNKPGPEYRTAQGHAFLQRYAVDMLLMLHTEETSESIAEALVKLSSDPQPIISTYAKSRFPRFSSLIKVQEPTELARQWTTNVADVFASEASRLAAMKRPPAASGQTGPYVTPTRTRGRLAEGPGEMADYGGEYDASMTETMETMETMDGGEYMMDDYGGGGDEMYSGMGPGTSFGAQTPEVFASRRRLIHTLEALRFGFSGSRTMDPPRTTAGLVTMLPEDQQLTATQLNKMIENVLKEINEPAYNTSEKFAVLLQQKSAEIRDLSEHLGKEAPAASRPGRSDFVDPLFQDLDPSF